VTMHQTYGEQAADADIVASCVVPFLPRIKEPAYWRTASPARTKCCQYTMCGVDAGLNESRMNLQRFFMHASRTNLRISSVGTGVYGEKVRFVGFFAKNCKNVKLVVPSNVKPGIQHVLIDVFASPIQACTIAGSAIGDQKNGESLRRVSVCRVKGANTECPFTSCTPLGSYFASKN